MIPTDNIAYLHALALHTQLSERHHSGSSNTTHFCHHNAGDPVQSPNPSLSQATAFSLGSSIPKSRSQPSHAGQAHTPIDNSHLFADSATFPQAQPSEPLDGASRYSVRDADPSRPGMQIDVVVSPGISTVDLNEIKSMLIEDIQFRQRNGYPPVEYYLYRSTGPVGDNRYGGDMSGNGVNFLDFTAIQDSEPFKDGIQIDVVIDPRVSPQDRQKIYAALQEWSDAMTGASGEPFEFLIWSDARKVREQGEFLNFTLLKDNGDRNYDGRTYWSTPDQGRLIAFEPGSPLSIVLHEIGHALPLPAHTDGAMRGVNPTLNIDPETIERVLKVYDLNRR